MVLVPQNNLMVMFLLLFMTAFIYYLFIYYYYFIYSVYSRVIITVLYEGVKQVFIGKLYCLFRIYSSKKLLGP